MSGKLDLETLRRSGLEGLMTAISDTEMWSNWARVLAQAGMCKDGVHGFEKEFGGGPIQPVVVWTNPETPAEKAITYFFPTS